MTFRELIVEGKKITVYHGDNYGTSKIEIRLMNNGNNQEGIGIYFGTLATAESYGKDIVSAEIDLSKFIDSRKPIGKYLNDKKIFEILNELFEIDKETFYYYITDWVEVYEPEDITDDNIMYLAKKVKSDQVRNFQIDLSQRFGVENFVKAWNKFTKIDGTFNPELEFYAILNPNIKLEKIK